MLYDIFAENVSPTSKHREVYSFGIGKTLHSGLKRFTETIEKCPKFVLTEDITFLIEQAAERTRPSAFCNGIPLCKLPYDKMWIEFPHQYRQNYRNTQDLTRYQPNEFAPIPCQLGYFLEKLDNDRISMTLGWSHPDESATVSMKKMIINVGKIEEVADCDFKDLEDRQYSWASKHMDDAKERTALSNLEYRFAAGMNEYMKEYVEAVFYKDQKFFERLMDEALYDIAGEWRFVLTLLMMVNSKNLLEFKEIDRTKLSKARVRRNRPPSPNYSEIHIHLTKTFKNKCKNIGMSRIESRAAMVMGHFKVRKTGIFWWSPYERNGEATVIPKYIL